MTEHDFTYWFGDVVDRLVSTGIGESQGPVTSPGKIHQMYAAARMKFEAPITLLAAMKMKECIRKGDNVLLITNSYEMDGPPGVAALARALNIGLGAVPIVVTSTTPSAMVPDPSRSPEIIRRTCIAAGMMPVDYDKVRAREHRVSIVSLPDLNESGAAENAEKIVDQLNPSIVLSSEARGRNAKGAYHSAFGFGIGPDTATTMSRPDHVLDAARVKGVPTISLGDNGNEMGFGTIEEIVRKYQPWGDKCRCPCGSGIASSVKADIVLPANISNWGCYGIEACLAHLIGNIDIMHDGRMQRRILHACADAGCADGATSFTTPTEDGTPYGTGIHLVELLRISVEQSFKSFARDW